MSDRDEQLLAALWWHWAAMMRLHEIGKTHFGGSTGPEWIMSIVAGNEVRRLLGR